MKHKTKFFQGFFVIMICGFSTLLAESSTKRESPSSTEKKKIILVLGSGGTKGLAHVGVIEELEKNQLLPDVIVGCSSGAIVGALYAATEDAQLVKKALIDFSIDDVLDYNYFPKQALSTRKYLEKFLDRYLEGERFCDLKIELITVATDWDTGECVYMKEGSVKDAVLASASLPGVFTPYEIDGKKYVDGGCSNPLPVDYAKSIGHGFVIASNIAPSLKTFSDDNILAVIQKSFEIVHRRLYGWHKEKADILIEMDFKNIVSPLDDSLNQEIYQLGKKKTAECMQVIKKRYHEK